MVKPSKARVRQSFERAALTYDSAAELQRQICTDMAAKLPSLWPNFAPQRVLDAGCGTGFAQSLLQQQFPQAQFIALDLSEGMLKQVSAGPNRFRLAGDAEYLPLANGCIELYWSSLAVQWCNLRSALAEAKRVIAPEGKLLLATLGPQTFHEVRQAFSEVDHHRHTLGFHSPDEVQQMALAAGFTKLEISSQHKTVYYPDLKTLLHAVKAIGANLVGDGRRHGLMTASTFTKASLAYEKSRAVAGLPLTYDIIQLSANV
ncbi:MAG: malonyl-[acyl-carrier protein] O-methyltransferase BioC [Pseudomonadota bacterium]|jgi:malonyl-CoA O-methyltransferase